MRAVALALLALAACAPKPEAPAPLAFDCARGFEALAADIASRPDLTAAPVSEDFYRTFNARDGSSSYVVTRPGAPGHPAVVRQTSGPNGVVTDGCPYGDGARYDQLLAYVKGLSQAAGR